MTVLALSGAGCGDALLPANYQGPPATEVGGSVVRTESAAFTEAQAPRFAVAWLSTRQGLNDALVGQPVAFTRSPGLNKDWDLGLSLPNATFQLDLGSVNATLAIGKVVYFDDRNNDDRLDWGCSETNCDRVKAVSHEFVVFLEQALACQPKSTLGWEKRNRLAQGFHYFRLTDTAVTEVTGNTDLRFELTDTPAAWVDPTLALSGFAAHLQRVFSEGPLGGC